MEKLYEQFKAAAEAVSAQVYRVKDLKEAGALLSTLAEEGGAKKIAAASSPMVDKCLENAALKAEVKTEDLRKHAEEACIGLSELDMAVAEIGSLQQDCTDLNKRLVSMLPHTHVALVKTESLVPTLADAIAKIDANKDHIPGYMAFITGPSRTADIERVLTIGVHGPAELKIIFVDNPGGVSHE
nr:lactate utilization protein [Desulforadius tongensis]